MAKQKTEYRFVINYAPYGIERPYNGLRLAINISKREEAKVLVCLIGDGILCARKGKKHLMVITMWKE